MEACIGKDPSVTTYSTDGFNLSGSSSTRRTEYFLGRLTKAASTRPVDAAMDLAAASIHRSFMTASR